MCTIFLIHDWDTPIERRLLCGRTHNFLAHKFVHAYISSCMSLSVIRTPVTCCMHTNKRDEEKKNKILRLAIRSSLKSPLDLGHARMSSATASQQQHTEYTSHTNSDRHKHTQPTEWCWRCFGGGAAAAAFAVLSQNNVIWICCFCIAGRIVSHSTCIYVFVYART